jgi:hypothetical protein
MPRREDASWEFGALNSEALSHFPAGAAKVRLGAFSWYARYRECTEARRVLWGVQNIRPGP